MKRVFSLLKPQMMADSLLEIPLSALKARGVKALIIDLDNTVVPWSGQLIDSAVAAWFADLAERGLKAYIVSNGFESRVSRLAALLGVPHHARAGKPLKRAYEPALAHFAVKACQTAVIGDQLFTDVLGGNALGAVTVLVKPLSRREFPLTKISRLLEAVVLYQYGRRSNE